METNEAGGVAASNGSHELSNGDGHISPAHDPVPNLLKEGAGPREIQSDAHLIEVAVIARYPSTPEERAAIRQKVIKACMDATDHKTIAALARVDATMESLNQRDQIAQVNAIVQNNSAAATREAAASIDDLARTLIGANITFIPGPAAKVISPAQSG